MATSLQVFQYAILTDANGERHQLGSMVDPVNLAHDFEGLVERRIHSLAASMTERVWAASDSPIEAFRFLWVRANQEDIYIQLVTDPGNETGDEYYTIQLKKNLAFVLGANGSFANYTADFGGGTLDVIGELWVRNEGSIAATVEVVVAQ